MAGPLADQSTDLLLKQLGLPTIDTRTAVLYSILFALCYVLSLYTNPRGRIGVLRPRDAPDVIRARMKAAFISSVTIVVVVIAQLAQSAAMSMAKLESETVSHLGPIPTPDRSINTSASAVAASSGYRSQFEKPFLSTGWMRSLFQLSPSMSLLTLSPSVRAALDVTGLGPSLKLHVVASLNTLGLLAVLFSGPLFVALVVKRTTTWPFLLSFDWLTDIYFWRSAVVGPLTEELVFRSAMLPLHLGAYATSVSATTTTTTSDTPSPIMSLIIHPPLYFGIAHINHLIENVMTQTFPPTPLIVEIAQAFFKFMYTTIFGAFASFVFLRTRSVFAAWAAHAFCNLMGIPSLAKVERSHMEVGKDGFGREVTVEKRWWTIAYYFLLVGGLVGFTIVVGRLDGDGWI